MFYTLDQFYNKYPIRTTYRTMRLGVSQLLGKLVVKYVSTYTKGTLKKICEGLI